MSKFGVMEPSYFHYFVGISERGSHNKTVSPVEIGGRSLYECT